MGCVRMNTLQENTLTIQIGGADAYTVRILKQPTLKSLNFTVGGETIELNETLDAWKREYTASVPYDAELIVNASATVDGVEVRVNGGTETAVKPEWTNLTAELAIALNADGAAESAYTVRLRQTPVKLEIAVQPVKTEYAIGEKFDPAGLELRTVYADESIETVPAEAIEYEPAGALTKDVSAITLKYAGLEIELPIRVGGALKGSGTAENPWKIESAADFETVREFVEQGVSISGEYLEMTEDVTLPEGWSPIGASMSNPFSGNLNGADHTLTIPENGLPLLGFVSGAKVSRLNIYGKKIAGYGLVNDLQGMGYSGTAVELEHITLKSGSATLKSGLIGTTPTVNQYAGCSKDFIVKISDCTVESGVVIGYNRDQRMIGSIAGRVNGTISGCISAATVYGTDYVGGILGTRDNALGVCEVRNCAFTGSVIAGGEQAGGDVGGGYSDSSAPNGVRISVIGCSASGSVSGHDKVGGILGGDSFVAQTWNASTFADNRFIGTVSGSGSAVGGVIGYYRSLNKWDDITGNYYASSCGASSGFGFVQCVDTNCASHETASGAIYFNTQNGASDCPAVTGCAWKKAHNRTDDPLGADAAKLMGTDGAGIVEVTSVALDKTELNLKIGETAILNANVTPENATDKTVRWSSSDESVAAVLNGTVTAKGFGSAVITASAGGFAAECAVQVTAEPAEYQRASAIATDKDKERANDVVSAINAIGVQIDEDSENAIANARGACDRLTDTQKALITNADQLKNAEAALEKLNGLGEFRNLYFETGDYLEKLGTPQVGSTGGEWMAIGLARSGRSVDAAYFERALDYVSQNIDENERLNANKCTENTRLILALTALGMDATDVGGYSLIDGIGELGYVRNQGINGPVWALIALDSNAYEPLPEGDATREALTGCILDAQLEDGGWAFTGDGADTDMTAMALQAIAPYYDPAADADNELNAAIERGVECLSMLQDSSGLFGTYAADGTMTATGESASQVIVALTALGIDPDQDERFIKNGVSALDALIHFGVANGGFTHLENAERDAMATEQGYYALTAYARYLMQLNRLYDMTDSFNDGETRIEPLRLYIGIAPKE